MNFRHFKPFIALLMLIPACALRLAAQSPPQPLCANVNDDGTVTLTWQIPSDVGPFDNFEIFRNQGAGFVSINVVGSTQTTYLDGLADASVQSLKYYIKTIGSSISPPSQTISTIFLELSSSDLGSVALLNWNSPFTPMPVSGEFVVERKIGSGPYEVIKTLPPAATSTNDTLYALCDEARSIAYRVSFHQGGCTMTSQTATGEFQDLLGPPVPEVETISVDPQTGDVSIYWFPVNSPDLEQYVVQDIDVGAQTYIDVGFIPAGAPTRFTYTGAPVDESTTFGVRAEDECGNEQNFNFTYTTIFTEAFYTECSLEALVAWSPYEGWSEGVEKYVVHAIVDGTEDQIFGETGPESFFFTAEVEPNRDYCFYVEAISNGAQRPSTSNGACVNTIYPAIIDFLYLSEVSVTGDRQITVSLKQDPAGEGVTYELYRSEGDSPFRVIANLNATDQETMEFVDTDVDPGSRVYTYYWKAYDGCGAFIAESNKGNNIVLSATADSQTVFNYLRWNAYSGWETGVKEYQLYRRLGSEDDFTLYATFNEAELTFEEDVEEFRTEEGLFCYRIEAVERINNSFGSKSVSVSNTACAVQEPLMWIPNAMVINGFNDEFKPVGGFIDFESFRMEIYNKWGNRIFHTNDIDEGWDGKYQGDAVREDYYRYIISYRDGAGKPYIEEGALYVLKNGKTQ